ncbi:hypothetical protein [Streptomyces sp. URMC 129]|uniref:hypothetical protein n=1 Tax=Streptomyces sp. URMC 129 TaxID=3423407 RepID=UPI003F1A7F7E
MAETGELAEHMGSENRMTPRMTEDLRPTVAGGPEHYARTTERLVRYARVAAEDGGVLGYLWWADADAAAGYVPRAAGGDDAYNAGVAWTRRLRACKARGLAPSQAVAELTAAGGGTRIGHVVAGSESETTGLAALRELAAGT